MEERPRIFFAQPCLFCGEPIPVEECKADPATVAEVSIEVAITYTQHLAHLRCLDAATHPSADYRAVPREMEAQMQAVDELRQQVRDAQSDG